MFLFEYNNSFLFVAFFFFLPDFEVRDVNIIFYPYGTDQIG